ncbi:MAG: hypothetical protein HKP58_12195 [Desulfatitalea sp.]|nr:hypothetical protein [Desulfatitalea sp.]NNK01162.1 hypothetical protein [Desulfatitalea sp.]
MTEKIPINGLKLSEPLVAVRSCSASREPDVMGLLCDLFARHHINMAYMTAAGGADALLCCICAEDQDVAAAHVAASAVLKSRVAFGEAVGLLTFYPHHADLSLLGKALQILSNRHIGILGWASSIAALTLVIDFEQLEAAAESLLEQFQLPLNAAPLRADFKVRQT